MVRNYLTSALRAISKNRIFSVINMMGLTIGLSSILIITLFVVDETSYDKFFDDSERIYRVALKRIYPERERLFASSATIMAEVLRDNYEEVEDAARLHRMYFVNEITVEIEDDSYNEGRFYFADDRFFSLFSHKFLDGDPETALKDPSSVVLTKSTALKYFNDEMAVNKTINIDTTVLVVGGVIEDIPSNSHIHFDVLGSIQQVPYLVNSIESNNWINPWLYTYIKLREGVEATEFEAKLDSMVLRFGGGTIAQSLGPNYAEEGHKFDYFLQPLEDIHLHSDLDIEVEANGDFDNVLQLSAIAVIILIISCINFINLSTAKSAERAKEVGVRKVMGSLRSHLMIQFIAESLILTLIATILAGAIVYFTLPIFNGLLSKSLTLAAFVSWQWFSILSLFIILVGIISGLYPAFNLSSHKPVNALKGSYKSSSSGIWLRNFLMIFQFFISVVMIATTVAVNSQMNFLRSMDLGFNKENVLVIPNSQTLGTSSEAFRNELLNLPGVVAAGGSFAMPGDFLGSNVMRSVDQPDLSDFRCNTVTVDDYFIGAMEFDIVQGRQFGPEFNDSLSVIVNESLVEELGLSDPLGSKIASVSNNQSPPELTIVGVIRDYNFLSLHAEITPLVIFNGSSQFTPPIMAVRFNSPDITGMINDVEETWGKHTLEPFSYSYLDSNLDQQYSSDRASSQLFDLFTYLAIFISCMGLFGLATYLVQQKAREMSIRKVMGANSWNISSLFIKDFLKLALISFVLAIPAAIWTITAWLEGFAYRIPMSVSIFVYAGAITVAIILATLLYQIMRIVSVNPVETIRD